MMLEAPRYEKLITALYPEGDEYIKSDAVFGYVIPVRLLCIGIVDSWMTA